METFTLENHTFIELNKLLKILTWVGSGGEAKQMIDEGFVQVNGQVEKQRRKKLRKGDEVAFNEQKVRVV